MSASFLLSQEAEGDRDALGALLRHPLSGSVGAKVRDSAMGFIRWAFCWSGCSACRWMRR